LRIEGRFFRESARSRRLARTISPYLTRDGWRDDGERRRNIDKCANNTFLVGRRSDNEKYLMRTSHNLSSSLKFQAKPVNKQQAIERIRASLLEGAELRTVLARDCSTAIFKAAGLITDCLQARGKLLFFGNGGSAADAQHLAAEFVGRFVRERAGLPAIALTSNSSILTAVGNDYGFSQIFARQVQALALPGDVAIAISTSGNSPNVIEGVRAANKGKVKTIGLTGNDGGLLAKETDLAITIASTNPARIQECHTAVGHLLCELAEEALEIAVSKQRRRQGARRR
jgi:D-sedoheptulose 7-phosphate isomerase